ncbi:carboxypeptidase-like regulatory domain-containing protein [Mucilaginibacter terrae]|uniref:Carboxypeptidase regulatory-like domain-containing protein n=1 Tax=Mucilaginibacter terrae TaxID=1955052 RepID=A0ABU3GR87_9SPHI|nr:carboxypeptidase-like regulatory domain-containing protein [Mucilaginibacter terrae]MDT3402298.1 hypothetical protein [Mucilaginibacter terrae]
MKYLYSLFIFMLPLIASAQTLVTGKVTNERNEPLQAITVTEKGTGVVRFTDEKGLFTIPLHTGSIIRLTGVGVEPVDVPYTGKNGLVIVLRQSRSQLDEVQVIAYGTNTQRFNTGSVTAK